MFRERRCLRVIVALTLSQLIPVSGAVAAEPAGAEWHEGVLFLAMGTAEPGLEAAATTAVSLRRDDGSWLHLRDLSDDWLRQLGGPVSAAGRRVRVLVPADGSADGALVTPVAVRAAAGSPDVPEVASGSYPYASLMCAFSNVALPPEGIGYFLGMYADVWPGLDHYWRRQSYGLVDVVGSTAAGWFTLPHTREHYTDMIVGGNYSPMLTALYTDCTNAAAGSLNLNDYEGVNLMFNAEFGPYAWGGWGGVTWEPPWGWHNVAVIAHEMGHAFGLPHSNNADNDGYPYDNPWDVMSDTWGWVVGDGTYGNVGKHTISYHKDILGWIAAGRRAEVTATGVYRFTVDHLTLAETSNLHMVKVRIPGSSRFYTVEVRDRVSYDGNLPGFAVIIHEVDTGREEPAWLVDLDNPSNGADAGAMWTPGECFDDPVGEVMICVTGIATEGYAVEVSVGDVASIHRDGFESGTTSAWSAVAP